MFGKDKNQEIPKKELKEMCKELQTLYEDSNHRESWHWSDILDNDGGGVVTNDNEIICGANTKLCDSKFIAALRNHYPKLMDEIKRLRGI